MSLLTPESEGIGFCTNDVTLRSVYTRCDIAVRCRSAIDTENGLQKIQQGCLHKAQYGWRHNDVLPKMPPVLHPFHHGSSRYHPKSYN